MFDSKKNVKYEIDLSFIVMVIGLTIIVIFYFYYESIKVKELSKFIQSVSNSTVCMLNHEYSVIKNNDGTFVFIPIKNDKNYVKCGSHE